MTKEERAIKEQELWDCVEKELPNLKQMIDSFKNNPMQTHITFHQDAFAGDYQDDEYVLIGKVIKLFGVLGIKVIFIGKNGETFGKGVQEQAKKTRAYCNKGFCRDKEVSFSKPDYKLGL